MGSISINLVNVADYSLVQMQKIDEHEVNEKKSLISQILMKIVSQ